MQVWLQQLALPAPSECPAVVTCHPAPTHSSCSRRPNLRPRNSAARPMPLWQ